MFMIKEIPFEERPRERFLKYPPSTISNHELIAIILRTGSKEESVIELAKKLLYQYPSLKVLSNTTIKELMKIRGIGKSKAIELLAAFELGRRVIKESFNQARKLHSPEAIYQFLKPRTFYCIIFKH